MTETWCLTFMVYRVVELYMYVCIAVKAVRDEQTQQLLLCIAYIFEVLTNERGPQHQVYRLVGH